MKFKIGDRVRVAKILKYTGNIRSGCVGKEYVIRNINPNGDSVYGTHYGVEGPCPYIFHEDELELCEFTKKDLKNGDVILKRNSEVEIVCVETGTCITKNGWNGFCNIKDDLTSVLDPKYDVMAVRRPNSPGDCGFYAFKQKRGQLVYEREEVAEIEEMTLEEVCKALGKEIKIVKNKGE